MTTDHTSLYLRSQDPTVKITSPYPVAVLIEDDTIDLKAIPEEEPVATLKFPKFTSRAIRRFHESYCKEKVAEVRTPARHRTQDPADAEEYIPNEWTPGRPQVWKDTLKTMVEEAQEEEEAATGR